MNSKFKLKFKIKLDCIGFVGHTGKVGPRTLRCDAGLGTEGARMGP